MEFFTSSFNHSRKKKIQRLAQYNTIALTSLKNYNSRTFGFEFRSEVGNFSRISRSGENSKSGKARTTTTPLRKMQFYFILFFNQLLIITKDIHHSPRFELSDRHFPLFYPQENYTKFGLIKGLLKNH